MSHNSNARAAEFERMVEEGLNKINIGPGGLTGEHGQTLRQVRCCTLNYNAVIVARL